MPSVAIASEVDYKKRISQNINRLANEDPLNVAQCFQHFNEPYMAYFFEIYKEYSCEPSTFLHCVLTTIGALSKGIRLSSIISHDDMSINLMTHVIGEPGSQKSNLIRVVRHALHILETLFPSTFLKKKPAKTTKKNVNNRNYHLLVQNDTELGLTKTLAARGNVYVISDEIDMFNNRFGVYGVSDEKSIAGSKLLCQGFDGIVEEARATGSSIFNIKTGTISLLGTSTGDKVWTNTYKFAENIVSDGVVVRFTYHILPILPMAEPPVDYFVFFPNLIHVLIIIILVSKRKAHMVFRQLSHDVDNQSKRIVPPFMVEEHTRHGIDIPMIEKLSNKRPVSIGNAKPADKEEDGKYVSAYTAARQIIHQYLNQTKENSLKSHNNSFLRSLFSKTGIKLPRYCAALQLLYFSIKCCRQLTKHLRFDNGLHINKNIDLNQLNEFVAAADRLIDKKFEQKQAKGTYENRVILPIKKPSVIAGKLLYEYSLKTALNLFNSNDTERFTQEQQVSSNALSSIDLCKPNESDLHIVSNVSLTEKQILLTMSTPFISKSWFTNHVVGVPYSGLFKNNTALVNEVVEKLLTLRLLVSGYFIVNCKKESYAKVSPCAIRADSTLLLAIKSMNIDIEEYEKNFHEFVLPSKICLNQNAIDFIMKDIDYVPFFHLFINQTDFLKQLQSKIADGVVQEVNIDNKKRFTVAAKIDSTASSQFIPDNDLNSDLSHQTESSHHSLNSQINFVDKVHEVDQSPNHSSTDTNNDEPTETNKRSSEDADEQSSSLKKSRNEEVDSPIDEHSTALRSLQLDNNQMGLHSDEDHLADASKDMQCRTKRKKTTDKKRHADKISNEVGRLIENLPPSRKRTCKIPSYS
ncbi:unnamed protein product [Adineta ricciae]|uniref:DUF3987 domain-containing protein n=1 Tax=Adineta ricciae TaxID=249248 RepID=A0A815NR99_ADIRI|nr:unnamed protein product [Adineta ricciae]CAF1441622.1 unnamed protein product [Adineta ricciae]